MTRDEELLVEQVTSAHRPPDAQGRIAFSSAWHDLDETGRAVAYEAATRARQLERALDPRGLSSTARAVLARLSRP